MSKSPQSSVTDVATIRNTSDRQGLTPAGQRVSRPYLSDMRTLCAACVTGWIMAGSCTAQTSVISPAIAGFVKVDLPANQMRIIATPLNTMNSGSNNPAMTLDQVLGTNNLTAYYDPLSADNVYLWTGTNYLSAWLADDGWGDPGGVDWKWVNYDPTSGLPALCATNRAFDVKIGQGLWVLHRNTATTIYLSGEVPQAAITTNALNAGLTMSANPYPVSRTLDQLIGTNVIGTTA